MGSIVIANKMSRKVSEKQSVRNFTCYEHFKNTNSIPTALLQLITIILRPQTVKNYKIGEGREVLPFTLGKVSSLHREN